MSQAARVLVVLDNFIVNQKLVVSSFQTALSHLHSHSEEKIVYVLPTFFPFRHSVRILLTWPSSDLITTGRHFRIYC